MRTELYSVRSSVEEISQLRSSINTIKKRLSGSSLAHILYITGVDRDPKRITEVLLDSLSADNPPEQYIFANALDTEDSESFVKLFTGAVTALEEELGYTAEQREDGSVVQRHIIVHTIPNLSTKYKGYCLTALGKRLIFLPRVSLTDMSISDFLTTALENAAPILENSLKTKENASIELTVSAPEKEKANPREKKDTSPRHEAIADKRKAEKGKPQAPEKQEKSPKEKTTEQKTQADSPTPLPQADEKEAKDSEKKAKAPEKEAVAKKAKESKKDKAQKKITAAPVADAEAPTALSASDDAADTDAPTDKAGKPKHSAKAFFLSFIPQKSDPSKTIAKKILVLTAIAAFLVGAFLLLNFYVFAPLSNAADLAEIQNLFHGSGTAQTDADGNLVSTDEKNWDEVQKVNKEIIGWVSVDNTKIDYPVLLHKGDNADSQYYLYRNYKNKYSDSGSIFVDYRCEKGVDSKNVILHGHNMGSSDLIKKNPMFEPLLGYARKDGWTKGNTDFYKKSAIVKLDTPAGERSYIVFAVIKLNVSNERDNIFNYLMSGFESDAQFMNYVYNVKVRSYLDINVPINEDDSLLTLSTCSYEADNMRTVVFARMLRQGEDAASYIKTVKENSPVSDTSATFSEKYTAGEIKWYDGDGKLDGNEKLEYMTNAEMFVVKFVDANGNELSKQDVLKGKDAKPPKTEPRKAADGTYYYVFTGWDKSYKNVTKNLTIKPVYERHRMETAATTVRETEPEDIAPETDAPVIPVTQAPTQAPPPTVVQPTPAATAAPISSAQVQNTQ